jgi:hypothetical protein
VTSVRLEWEGKPTHVERLSLPFQTVETINESRATRERDTGSLLTSGTPSDTPRDMLIWGENRLVMSSLLNEYAGRVQLAYIDPPFDTGADFSYRLTVGDGSVDKLPSILEEHAYRDTWGAGKSSYLSMMWERVQLIHELLSEDGSFYLHCAPNVSHYLKLLCDEVFGAGKFRTEIIWKRSSAHSDTKQGRSQHGRIHDVLLFYTKGEQWTWNQIYVPYDDSYIESKYRHLEPETGRRYRLGDLTAAKPGGDTSYQWRGRRPYKGRYWAYTKDKMDLMHAEGRIRIPDDPTTVPEFKRYLDEQVGVPIQDLWNDLDPINAKAIERLGYPTQKPSTLLERIVATSSSEGDLVADFFCGSGTTLVVAEKLNRRWIGCDLGRFAIHTTRKRLLNIPDCRPFDIKNLGAYERQHWQQASSNGAVRAYLDTILAFYRAEPVEGFAALHGRKAGRMVHVGATDAPVTIDEAEEVMDEMADNGIEACDVLGWEWEMGLHDTVPENARRRGLDLRLRQIPREVMERQVAEADAVRFFELAHVDLDVRRQAGEACVVLKDFIIPSEDLIPPKVRERITSWSDLIDYWSVDFDHRDETFHNQWQAYRTRAEPALATQSDWHEYPGPGRYSIMVKIIDIFGNDTTKLAEVRIK